MRINLLSSFAAGILISTSICGAVYFSGKGDVSKAAVNAPVKQTSANAQPTENEMKTKLSSAGYVVQTQAEYDKNMKNAKASAQKNSKSSNQSKDKSGSQKTVTKVIVSVSQGMTSIDVGNTLQQTGLIPDAFKFSQDIQSRGVENNLRPGTYVVDSSMSYDQIISTIFK